MKFYRTIGLGVFALGAVIATMTWQSSPASACICTQNSPGVYQCEQHCNSTELKQQMWQHPNGSVTMVPDGTIFKGGGAQNNNAAPQTPVRQTPVRQTPVRQAVPKPTPVKQNPGAQNNAAQQGGGGGGGGGCFTTTDGDMVCNNQGNTAANPPRANTPTQTPVVKPPKNNGGTSGGGTVIATPGVLVPTTPTTPTTGGGGGGAETPDNPTPVENIPAEVSLEPVNHAVNNPVCNTIIPVTRRGPSTMNFSVFPTGEQPGVESTGIGAFRNVCGYSHMSFDDPIVYPGQPGLAHLHTFFGNSNTNANSTAGSLATTGGSTCRGGIANRSAYWVPALFDSRDCRAIAPGETNHFYYKTGYRGVRPQDVRPFPRGLRMIAGSATSTGPQEMVKFGCNGGNWQDSIPDCPGSEVWMNLTFPQCWDGVNLDSPNHKSHMAYANGGCPSSHPVPLPEIAFNIIYPVSDTSRYWRLSSDMYGADRPGGMSFHGDWFDGWDPSVMQAWVRGCNNAAVDCHSHLLGDGRAISFP